MRTAIATFAIFCPRRIASIRSLLLAVLLTLAENLIHLIPHMLTPRRLQVPHRGLHVTAPRANAADQIEQTGRALTADELARVLSVSRITIFKQAKAGRIPSFRIGTCVRFDRKTTADWLRKQ